MMSPATRLLVVAAVVGGLSGCTGVAATVAGGDPFEGFPACETPDTQVAATAGDVPGLVLPEDAVVTSTTRTGPITDVSAYVPLTPLDVRAFYEEVRRDHDAVEILQLEDEVFETEVLLADGSLRSYLIARTACREGSTITGFIAPESAVADLPTGQVGSR